MNTPSKTINWLRKTFRFLNVNFDDEMKLKSNKMTVKKDDMDFVYKYM